MWVIVRGTFVALAVGIAGVVLYDFTRGDTVRLCLILGVMALKMLLDEVVFASPDGRQHGPARTTNTAAAVLAIAFLCWGLTWPWGWSALLFATTTLGIVGPTSGFWCEGRTKSGWRPAARNLVVLLQLALVALTLANLFVTTSPHSRVTDFRRTLDYVLPVILLASLLVALRAAERGRSRWEKVVVIATALALVVAAFVAGVGHLADLLWGPFG